MQGRASQLLTEPPEGDVVLMKVTLPPLRTVPPAWSGLDSESDVYRKVSETEVQPAESAAQACASRQQKQVWNAPLAVTDL